MPKVNYGKTHVMPKVSYALDSNYDDWIIEQK